MEWHWPNGGGHVTVCKDSRRILLFLGRRSLIKDKKQTALMTIVNFRIFSYASQDTLSKLTKSDLHTERQVYIKMRKFTMFITAVCV